MHLIAAGWIYVVGMMAVAEALSSQGTLLGAFFTFVLYGVVPLAIVLYTVGTPARKRARRAAEHAATSASASAEAPDGRGGAAGDAIAPEREEP